MTSGSQRTTALVTGASGGIGYELAKIFAQHGYDLVLVARNQTQLQTIADELSVQHGIGATVIALDLTDHLAPDQLHAELHTRSIAIDVLINNAGFASYGPFAEAEVQQQVQMLQLNVVALTHLTRLLLPDMIERRRGKILNVASTAAFMPGPLMAVYYASKAYVLSFSEALNDELRGTGVGVTALCPGPTETGFQRRAAMEQSRLVQSGLMDAATVALAGYRGLMRGSAVVIPGRSNVLLTLVPRLLPRSIVPRLVRRAQDRTH